MSDPSNGYEAAADEYIRLRSSSKVGALSIGTWAATLPPGASVIDLGCGAGEPVTRVLVELGLSVSGVDASPAMISAMQRHFPSVRAECSTVEQSVLLDSTYDAAIAWGLMFLLDPAAQETVIARVGNALRSGGKFLFTAPWQDATWADSLTGRNSRSLGREQYKSLLEHVGMSIVQELTDEGQNHYFSAIKR